MHSKRELDQLMEQAGIRPLKKLGQNFLVNPAICKKIVAEVDPQALSVVEIGPGLGALTSDLIGRSEALILIEMDSGLVQFWRKRGQEVLHQDAMQVDWQRLRLARPAVLVSNLPYSIAASIVVGLSQKVPFDQMVLMFQKEVASRITAKPKPKSKDYGILSVIAQANWDVSKVVDAGPQDFFPVPHVGSRVLRFKLKTVAFDRTGFVTFVKAAFAKRRKKLLSNLSGRYKKDAVDQAFRRLGLHDNCRAEELDVETFLKLFNIFEAT